MLVESAEALVGQQKLWLRCERFCQFELLEPRRAEAIDAGAAIGRQARSKRVPQLTFSPDPSVRAGERIDSILREIDVPSDDDADELHGGA